MCGLGHKKNKAIRIIIRVTTNLVTAKSGHIRLDTLQMTTIASVTIHLSAFLVQEERKKRSCLMEIALSIHW